MKDHPLAELFPLMDEPELVLLAADIEKHGQRAPILLLDGQILDGRNRYRACLRANIEPRTKEFSGRTDPLDFVLSANLHRRHLTESQRAMVAAKISQMSVQGGDREESKSANLHLRNRTENDTQRPHSQIDTPTIAEAAARMSVSPRIVKEARKVLDDKRLAKAVTSGARSVHAAVREIKAAQEAGEVHRDKTGYAIPSEILPLWNRGAEIVEIQKTILRAEQLVKQAHEQDDPLWAPVNAQGIAVDLHNSRRKLDAALPYAVCCTCQGRGLDTCMSCKGRGFISRRHYEDCVPVELKAIRAKSCVR